MEGVDDRVCVKVEDTLLQLLQVAVELETSPTGGESRDKDVDLTIVWLICLQVLVDHFERLVVPDLDLTDVVEGIGDQGKEPMCFVNDSSGGLVEILAKLAPKTIQHQPGGGFASSGFLTIRFGSRSMPSLCLYCQTYWDLSVGVTAQAG